MAFVAEVVLGKICEMAVQKLAEEAKLVVNFRKDFKWLNDQLTYVRGFLKDADQQSRHKEGVKRWLENIQVISWLAEDICEECAVESMYGNNAQSCGLSCNQWIFRYRIGRKIKDIKDRISSIIEEGNELKLFHEVSSANEASPSTSQSGEWKRSSLLPSDSHSVAIRSKVDDMLRLLNNNASPVIAVVGMGGMGKTYLLQHVFNNINIKERYEKSIWLSVSQSYSISKLQRDIASHLGLEGQIRDGGVSEQRAAELIFEEVQGKRCLVVLDDLWRASREEDLLGKLGLPTGNNSRCQIVVTTRNRDVCTNLKAEVYEMQYLSDEDSWKLFCVYAFEENREAEQHLEEVGRKIVKQCGNLPLAIKTIAASLAKSRMPREWESKLHQLEGVNVTANVDPIMPILRLSYDSLPARLKACFAYLSFFPEDEEINCEYLIYLWIGEGFIPGEGEGQWDTAWDCLYQLANLCLLQLWEIDVLFVGLTKYCRIHDLLLDLAIHISKDNKCVFSVEEACQDTSGDFCRILLGKREINDDAISERRPVCLRTFSLSQNEEIFSIPANLFTAMRGLRVLDLSGTRISTLPESIGKMKLLKVLNLRGTDIVEVPECVRHLKSLLFLVLPECVRHLKLPVWINEVKCLQHLECRGCTGRIAKGISKLVSLRKLRSGFLDVSVGEDEFMRSEDFGNMTQLQELWLNVRDEMELKGMEEGIFALLLKMRHLLIKNSTQTELELPEKMTAMEDLESLYVQEFRVPSWILGLANLRELQLRRCDCIDYPELQKIPNLVRLALSRNDRCRELPKVFGKAGGFPHLRFLKIYSFSELEEFPELEEGAMACLEELELHHCSKLKKVGEGLELLKTLKLFGYYNSGTNELRETFKEGGEYWNKIKAINPHIEIICRGA